MADISFKALELHNSAIKELDKYNYEQEHRQLRLKEKILKITVNVSRQDFPAISSDVDIFYTPTASQAAWTVFLADVRTKLNIEFVDQIIDRGTLNTVHRTLSLRNGAQYFVRQREESSVIIIIIFYRYLFLSTLFNFTGSRGIEFKCNSSSDCLAHHKTHGISQAKTWRNRIYAERS